MQSGHVNSRPVGECQSRRMPVAAAATVEVMKLGDRGLLLPCFLKYLFDPQHQIVRRFHLDRGCRRGGGSIVARLRHELRPTVLTGNRASEKCSTNLKSTTTCGGKTA